MARTRRTIIDDGFQTRGQDWNIRSLDEDNSDGSPNGLIDFPVAGYRVFTVDFQQIAADKGLTTPEATDNAGFYTQLTVWKMGIVSLGPPTAGQIAFAATGLTPFADPAHSHQGFPGEFVAIDVIESGTNGNGVALVQLHSQFGYAIGAVDYEKDPTYGFDADDMIPTAAFFFGDPFDSHQAIFVPDGFSVFPPEFEAVNRYGYKINSESATGSGINEVSLDDLASRFDIFGSGGNDILIGGHLRDVIQGEGGNDWISGVAGNDSLNGGLGADFFVFDFALNNSEHSVNDYAPGDTLFFYRAPIGPTFAVGGGNVTVNGVTLAGAAAGNVTVVTQASEAAAFASPAQIGAVLISGHSKLDEIGGAYSRTLFDANNDEPWRIDQSAYDATGALDFRLITYDGGNRLLINYDQTNGNSWTTITDTYNALSQLTQKATVLDAGGSFTTFYDVTGAHPWSQSTNGRDALNRLDYQDVRYDDGTRILTDFDQANNLPWVTSQYYYNAGGQLVWRRVNYDDGRYDVTFEDFANNQSWNKKIDTYTDGVNRDFVNFLNDNGTRKTVDFDQLSNQPWSVKEILYNAANQAVSDNTLFDNGTRILKSFDPANLNNTKEVIVGYDALGRADYINTLYDDNSRIVRDYDQANAFAWSEHVFVYNSAGVLTHDYFVV